MPLRVSGSSSGYVELASPAVGGNNTLYLPTGNGSEGNIVGTDGSGNLSWVNGRMVLETAKASTSGTSVDFTGIPSWVKRITVMFNEVSTSGTGFLQVRIGPSGALATSGYKSGAAGFGSGALSSTVATSGFVLSLGSTNVAMTLSGSVTLTLVTGNTWMAAGSVIRTDTGAGGCTISGSIGLSGTLADLRITTVNGTDTFDAGSINILYEG